MAARARRDPGVRVGNPALHLYERLGYKIFNEDGKFTRTPVAVERGLTCNGHPGYIFMDREL